MKKYGIILAGGKGSRMPHQDLPKVLFSLKGRPIVGYLIDTFIAGGVEKPILVVGYKRDLVKKEFGDRVDYAIQKEQLGTGHGVMMTEDFFKGKSVPVLIAYGDMPFWQKLTIEKMFRLYQTTKAKLILATAIMPNNFPYGRIVRNKYGELIKIVEEKDCDKDQLEIKEKNPGLYLVKSGWLFETLAGVNNENVQNEYYLTDIVEIAVKEGVRIETYQLEDWHQAIGINTQEDLDRAEEEMDQC